MTEAMPKGKVTGLRFFRVNRLIDDLRRERVDQNLSYKYLLGLMILHNIAVVGSSGNRDLYLTALLLIATVTLVVLEVKWCNTINKQGDNRDFVKRYIAISFVIDLILLLFSMISAFFLTVAVGALFKDFVQDLGLDMTIAMSYFAFIIGITARIVFIFWKAHSFRIVSKPLMV